MMNSTGVRSTAWRGAIVGIGFLTVVLTSAWVLTATKSAAPERAFSIRDALPSGSFAHVSFAGLRSGEKCRDTAIARIWNDPQMQEFVKPLLEMAKAMEEEAAGGLQESIGMTVEEVKQALWGGFTISVVDVQLDMEQGGPPDIDAVLTFDLSANPALAGAISGKLGELASGPGGLQVVSSEVAGLPAQTVDIEGVPLTWVTVGNWILGGTKTATLEGVCTRIKAGTSTGGLTENPDFVTAWKRTVPSGEPMFYVYVDVSRVLAIVESTGQMDAKLTPILDAVGLTSMGGVSYAFAQEGQGFTDRTWIGMPKGGKGIYSGIKHSNNGLRTIAMAPRDSWVYGAGRFDFSGAATMLLENISAIDTDLAANIDQGIADIEESLGFNLRQDVLANLGQEFSYWVGSSPFGGLIPEIVIAMEVRDGRKIAECIDKAIAGTSGESHFGGLVFQGAKLGYWNTGALLNKTGGFGPGIKPTWLIDDGFIFVTLTPQTMKNFFVARKNGRPAINANADFNNGMAQLRQFEPEAGKDGAGYMDIAALLTMLIDTAVPVVQSIDMGEMGRQIPVDFAKFPTTDVFQRNLFGLTISTTNYEQGISSVMYSPCGYLPAIGIVAAGVGSVVALQVRSSMADSEPMIEIEPLPEGDDRDKNEDR